MLMASASSKLEYREKIVMLVVVTDKSKIPIIALAIVFVIDICARRKESAPLVNFKI